jgi:peptidoglycan hydrolase-like protein with peptidoglycan-binding domain
MKQKIAFAAFVASVLIAPVFASASVISMELSPGMSGSDVSALQTFLAADSNIYPEGIISGFYGPLTTAAVERYQTSVGISPVGRVGPITLASINNAGTDSAGGAFAPYTKTVTATPSVNSANINWLSNEAITGRVMYSTTWPFVYSIAQAVSTPSGYNALQAVTLSGLSSKTTYYYVLESTDNVGNLSYTIGNSFKTN